MRKLLLALALLLTITALSSPPSASAAGGNCPFACRVCISDGLACCGCYCC
jgi:hypothetical protein